MNSTSIPGRLIPQQARDPFAARGLESLAQVLVVDDDAAMGGTVVEVLALDGIVAAAATTATAAITLQRRLRPAVVVCDQRLPDMSGLDLCAAIRAIDPDVSLILLTGHASLDSAIAAVGQIDQYLVKPAAPEELRDTVVAGVERCAKRRAERAAAEELRQALEAQLRQQALHDNLTGLPNRALFVERAQHALDRRDCEGVVVCFLDLDDFKDVNDTYGHGAGDDLLRVVAGRLIECVRPADTVARFGGDEFAVLLEDTDLAEAMVIVDRFHAALGPPIRLGDIEFAVRASVGIAPSRPGHTAPEQLVAEADSAMYAAKAAGGHGVAVFDAAMRRAGEARARLRSDLDKALRAREFRLEYQPIIDLRSGERVGHEALIRWDHAERGRVLPADFIDHAETTGQIMAIGDWVLRAACCEIGQLRAGGLVSVNVSARQLHQPGFVDNVAAALSDAGLPARRLVLEITETATVTDTDRAIAQLTALRHLGLMVAMDDFGTGYASLSYLRRFPVDYLKIDRSFIRAITTSAADFAIVRGVIDIAHGLGLRAIAEGVETQAQHDLLVSLDCDFAQGFLWTRPIPVDQLATAATR